jgi:hypothetical protein
MSRRWWAAGAITLTAACLDLGTDPSEIGAISFDGIPYPAVVAGDTMRNEAGQVTPLRATVRSGAGDTVTGATVQFFTRDTLVTLTSTGLVLGRAPARGTARLFATADGLQSITREIEVVLRPDSVALAGAPDTLFVSSVDTTNNSGGFRLRLLNKASGSGVKGFLVRYVLEFRGQVIAPGDTTQILLVDDSGRPSALDTTDASGEASRRVHARVPQMSGVSDSAVVRFRVSAGPTVFPEIQREFVRVLHIRPRTG